MPENDALQQDDSKYIVKRRKRRIWITVLISVSVLCAAVIICVLWMTGSANKEKDRWNLGETKSYSYTNTGENDDWSAVYQIDGSGGWTKSDDMYSYEGSYHSILTLSFTKDISEIPSVRSRIISYEVKNGRGRINRSCDQNTALQGTYKLVDDTHDGSFIYAAGDVFSVTINLDGQEQTIKLTEAAK